MTTNDFFWPFGKTVLIASMLRGLALVTEKWDFSKEKNEERDRLKRKEWSDELK